MESDTSGREEEERMEQIRDGKEGAMDRNKRVSDVQGGEKKDTKAQTVNSQSKT